jgi:hypothetical protein
MLSICVDDASARSSRITRDVVSSIEKKHWCRRRARFGDSFVRSQFEERVAGQSCLRISADRRHVCAGTSTYRRGASASRQPIGNADGRIARNTTRRAGGQSSCSGCSLIPATRVTGLLRRRLAAACRAWFRLPQDSSPGGNRPPGSISWPGNAVRPPAGAGPEGGWHQKL